MFFRRNVLNCHLIAPAIKVHAKMLCVVFSRRYNFLHVVGSVGDFKAVVLRCVDTVERFKVGLIFVRSEYSDFSADGQKLEGDIVYGISHSCNFFKRVRTDLYFLNI